MREPSIPKSGEEIKASTIVDIIRWVKSIIPRGDGKTIRIKASPAGSIISSYSEAGSAAVILQIESVLKYSNNLSCYIYKATAHVDFHDHDGAACYAIAVCSAREDKNNIIPEGNSFLGFSCNYVINEDSSEENLPVYMFDYPRWL